MYSEVNYVAGTINHKQTRPMVSTYTYVVAMFGWLFGLIAKATQIPSTLSGQNESEPGESN